MVIVSLLFRLGVLNATDSCSPLVPCGQEHRRTSVCPIERHSNLNSLATKAVADYAEVGQVRNILRSAGAFFIGAVIC
jgi:hypothetical protein